jgi:peptidoglycan/LPS O-acetylase OafA/YrhL
MRTADRGATQFADALRGIACLSVVCHHLVGQFLVQPGVVALYGLAQVPDGDALPVSNFFYRGGFGEFGVALFFLISGFVIPLSLERYGPRAFLIARCWRLVPTYMACFAVLLATVWLNGWMFGMARMPFSPSTIASNLLPGIRRFLGERDIYPGAWTLEIEVLFYLFCAACGAWWRGSIIILAGAGLLIASAASSYLTNRWSLYPQSGFIAFMLCGTAISEHFRGRMSSAGTAAVVAACYVMFVWRELGFHAAQYLVAIAAFILAYSFRDWSAFRSPILAALAAISYPLYLIHFGAGYLVLRYLIIENVSVGLSVLVAIACAVLLSFAVHAVVEAPTHRIGRQIATSRAHKGRRPLFSLSSEPATATTVMPCSSAQIVAISAKSDTPISATRFQPRA